MFSPSIPRTLINCVLACTCVLASTAVFASASTINTSYGTSGVSAPAPAPSYSVGNAVDHNDPAHGAYSLINAANTQNGGTPGVYSIVRRTATGALDTNFGVGGVIGSFPNNSGTGNYYWSTICIDPSTHYIVIAGNDGNGHFVAERLVPQSTSATFDPTFNPSGAVPGLVVTPPLSMGGGNPHVCLVAGDGAIFVAGSSGTGSNNITTAGVIVVAKINSDGSMAGTFGAGGMASIAVTDGSGSPLIPEVGGMDFNSDQSVNNDLIIAGDTYLPNTDGSTTSPLVVAVQRCDGALDTSFNGTGVYLNASFDSNAFSQSVYVRVLSTGYISLLYIAGQGNPPFTSDLVTVPFPFSGSGVTTAGPSTLAFPTGITPRGGVATNYDGTFLVGGNNASSQEVLTGFDGDPSFGFTVSIPATLATCPAGTPGISVNPTSVSFGSQAVGTSSVVQAITVNNTGTAALTVGTPTLTGTNQPSFSITGNTCTTAVAPSGTCAISVKFTPPSAGSKSANVSVPSNAAGSPTVVPLAGTGVTAPTISVNPTSVSFGSQAVGTSSVVQAITVNNTGTTSLTVGTPTLTGTNQPSFSITGNTCTTAVAPSGTCAISVKFTPPSAGSKSANVSVPSNAAGSPTVVPLAGTGVTAPTISVNPTSVSFGSQAVGTSSVVQAITVNNTGTTSLTVGTPTLTGTNQPSFSITGNTCTTAVAPSGTCAISVKFTPPSAGSKSANVSVPSNAAGSPTVVPLAGTGGVTSAISVNPTSLSFGSQAVGTTSAAQTITVHNTGTTTLSAIGWQLTGTNQPSFSIVSNSCSAPLAAGATCTIGVTFNPPGAGAKSAIVNITSSAGSPTVSLSGTGT